VIAHVLSGSVPPKFSPGALISLWQADPYALAGILLAGGLYWWGVRRIARTPPEWPWGRIAAFYGGLLVCVVALLSPVDRYAEVSFSTHMFQHVLLVMAAAPLFALGAPVTLALRAARPSTRRRVLLPVLRSRAVSLLTRPVVAWLAFAVVMYASHFTGLYNLALSHEWVHALEHLLYLGSGVLFWWPVVGLDPAPHRMSHAARILYVVLAMPLTAFLGVAILSASVPMYPWYAGLPAPWGGVHALTDQQNAGAIMWEMGGGTSVIAVLLVAAAWFRHDEARQRRIEQDMDRAAGGPVGLGAVPEL
jgi:cytochrome c oxidase assembly factor CtaG